MAHTVLLVLADKRRNKGIAPYALLHRENWEASMPVTRRQFLGQAAPFVLAAASGGSALAAMGPNDKFDLVIKGGDVLDPSQSLRGKHDIGIRFGLIEAVEAGASRREAAESFNLSPSSAVKWLQRWRDSGSAKARPSRGSTSP